MFESVEQFSIGLAVVVDTALLLLLRERVNRPKVSSWLLVLVFAAWAFHAGTFGRTLIAGTSDPIAQYLDQFFMTIIVVGLLLMPSGMLHSGLRMVWTGLNANTSTDYRFAWLYFPMALLPVAVTQIFASDERHLVNATSSLVMPYIVWLLVANVTTVGLYWKLKNRYSSKGPFFLRLILAIITISVLATSYGALSQYDWWERRLRLPICMSPLLPAGLFVWYTLRHRILPLVMDRTLIYGSLTILALLLHRVAIYPIGLSIRQVSNIDLGIVEVAVVVGCILFFRPLRNRIREALRCLFSTNVFRVRDATRGLSVSLSRKTSLDTKELIQWFVDEIANQLELDRAIICIQNLDRESDLDVFVSQNRELESQSKAEKSLSDLKLIHRLAQSHERLVRGGIDISNLLPMAEQAELRQLMEAMENTQTLVAFRTSYRSIVGCTLLGDRKRNDRFAEEQLVAISLLFDQLAATLENKRESIRRIQAERTVMQNEKLSVMGLIAGSIAHELRNPLSSIRTIASLTLEELGPQHKNEKDLSMIVTEIDRLAKSTQRLLDSAKPADSTKQNVAPDAVLSQLLAILAPFANKLGVEMVAELSCGQETVRSTEVTLHEIFFNLIKNGIEACTGRPNARVFIRSKLQKTEDADKLVEIIVEDNGPGVPAALQSTLFDPFVTGKPEGTGLGLFVVADRVRELRGSIRVVDKAILSDGGSGTEFHVDLPLWKEA